MGKGALYPFSWAGSLQYAKRGCGQNGFTFCHSPFFLPVDNSSSENHSFFSGLGYAIALFLYFFSWDYSLTTVPSTVTVAAAPSCAAGATVLTVTSGMTVWALLFCAASSCLFWASMLDC